MDNEDYDSSFEDDEEKTVKKDKRTKKSDLAAKHKSSVPTASSSSQGLPHKSVLEYEQARFEGYRNRYFALNAYERHRKLISDYYMYNPASAEKLFKRDTSKDKRDIDIIRDNHRFLWDDAEPIDTWDKQLAKKYYDKLYKEYCICDLSRYKENKVALRWRVQNELVEGKGQFSCGNKHCSNSNEDELKTWEVNFAYMEESVKKNALVKLRLCPECSLKLNYGHKRKEVTRKPKKRKSRHGESGSGSKKKRTSSEKPKASTSQSSAEETDSIDTSSANDIWKAPLVIEKSMEEVFQEYIEDLFM